MNGPKTGSATVRCGLAGEVVRTFGEVRIRVFGTSMVPSIHPGDLISIQRADLLEISPGEIALYLREGRLFAHRVVARAGSPDQPLLILRGDRLGHTDPPVSSSELLGRVTCIHYSDGRGSRQVQPAARPSGWKKLIVCVLQKSDRATCLYLRLAACWRSVFPRSAACRA